MVPNKCAQRLAEERCEKITRGNILAEITLVCVSTSFSVTRVVDKDGHVN